MKWAVKSGDKYWGKDLSGTTNHDFVPVDQRYEYSSCAEASRVCRNIRAWCKSAVIVVRCKDRRLAEVQRDILQAKNRELTDQLEAVAKKDHRLAELTEQLAEKQRWGDLVYKEKERLMADNAALLNSWKECQEWNRSMNNSFIAQNTVLRQSEKALQEEVARLEVAVDDAVKKERERLLINITQSGGEGFNTARCLRQRLANKTPAGDP